jgi:hypothetical protein
MNKASYRKKISDSLAIMNANQSKHAWLMIKEFIIDKKKARHY